jgi:hypothetical protein
VPLHFTTEYGRVEVVLTSSLDGGEWSASWPGHFSSKERATFIHWIWGWVEHRVGLDIFEKRKCLSAENKLMFLDHIVQSPFTVLPKKLNEEKSYLLEQMFIADRNGCQLAHSYINREVHSWILGGKISHHSSKGCSFLYLIDKRGPTLRQRCVVRRVSGD